MLPRIRGTDKPQRQLGHMVQPHQHKILHPSPQRAIGGPRRNVRQASRRLRRSNRRTVQHAGAGANTCVSRCQGGVGSEEGC